MKTNILELLFFVLIVLLLISLAALFLINELESESEFVDFKEITGAIQSYEIYHGTAHPKFINIRKSERYDDKYLEYLDNIQKSRAKTFLR